MKKIVWMLCLFLSCCADGEHDVDLVRAGIDRFERRGDIGALREIMRDVNKCDGCYRLEAYALLHKSISGHPRVFKEAWSKGDASVRSFILDLKSQSRPAYETFYSGPVPEVDWLFTEETIR